MPTVVEPCPFCGRGRAVTIDTDGRGRAVEIPDTCGCDGERRSLGVCRRCPAPVSGTVGKAVYCARCRGLAIADYGRRYRRSRKGKRAQRRENAKRRRPEERARLRLQERERRSRPDVKARIRERRRRESLEQPERNRERRRRYKEQHPDRVLEQQRRANEKRRQARLDYMHRYATKYVGPGRAPTCGQCGCDIPFDGRGRPHKLCRSCDPKRWRQSERRRARKEEQ